jgi:DNA polymerase III sliding clamp (beta) subunit (PCNA family)
MTGHLAEREDSAQAAPGRVSEDSTFDAGWIDTGNPLTPEEEGRSYPLIRLDAKDLKGRLKKMKPFMSTEETRYYLNGIFIRYDNQELTLCATNGHILQEQVFQVEAELSENLEPFSVICPRAAIEHLIKVIPTSKDAPFLTMQVISDGDDIRFDFFEFEYITSVVKGTFPDYQRIIPAGGVRLQSGLNASYLIDALKALNESAVDICVDSQGAAEHQPHLLTSSKADGVKCVIMPMRLD